MTPTDHSGTVLIADFDFGDVDIERSIIEGAGLLKLPNVITTPHAAYSEEAVTAVRRIAAEEAVRVLTGQPARFPVNDLTARRAAN